VKGVDLEAHALVECNSCGIVTLDVQFELEIPTHSRLEHHPLKSGNSQIKKKLD